MPTPAKSRPYAQVSVVGGGAWGTALASVLARAGREVTLCVRDAEVANEINDQHSNSRYLDGLALPDTLAATADWSTGLARAEAVLLVVPSAQLREVAARIAPYVTPGIPILLCAKGIEAGSGKLMSHVASDALPGHAIGALSGPTFAREAALGHPTAATCAFDFTHENRLTPEDSAAVRLAVTLTGAGFRAYVSDDLVGVEVGGAVKNVIAIACGMMAGAGFAENTRALLIARGLSEMSALATRLGGRRETLMGLSGMGDLTLTCSSPTSRNMALGQQLGQGRARKACFDGRPVVVEGEGNAITVTDLARRVGVAMPICETVRAILHEGAGLEAAFTALWTRPIREEAGVMDLSFEAQAKR